MPTSTLSQLGRLRDSPGFAVELQRYSLDLAVRGRLVAQDASDEPASGLLETIRTAMAKARARAPRLRALDLEEIPFEIPETWEWVCIREIAKDRGQRVPQDRFSYIDVGSIDNAAGRLGDVKSVTAAEAPSRARKVVCEGDVVYSCVRPYLLNVAVIDRPISPEPIASTAFAVLDGLGLVDPKYMWTVLRSPFMVELVKDRMRGQAYPAINDAEFALLPTGFPQTPNNLKRGVGLARSGSHH